MAFYIRPLTIKDLERCVVVESTAFPPAEAASREKIEYRLSVCPEICYGLFAPRGTAPSTRPSGEIPVIIEGHDPEDTLIAHVIATRSTKPTVKDEDMAFPEGWQASPMTVYEVGHQPEGRTIALHSLAVSPASQRAGFGKALMKAYLGSMGGAGRTDRVAILTYDRLVPYYQNQGFSHYGKSESNYAGVAWHDLAYEYKST